LALKQDDKRSITAAARQSTTKESRMTIEQIRFKRLGYVALNVADLEKSREFYEAKVGLTVDEPAADGVLFLRCSDRHHDIALYQSGVPGMKRVGWQMESATALQALRSHFGEIGVAMEAVSAAEAQVLGISEAYRASEPATGTLFEFYVDMTAAPAAYVPTHTNIARLGHLVIASTDRDATEAFLLDQMNFRASDRIDGMVTFMRCFPNPYHHSLGIAQSRTAESSLNHINFMVTEMADIGKGNNRMKQADIPIVFGIGKHPPSESVFLYFLDPDGITVEYSFGMEEFPEEGAREPRDMPATIESIDYWGGLPDPRAGAVGTIERRES
jgi:2,3-dihydroxy-p-cumate/2,3-dihydroxybenzoate 3,4-dioxygenase